MPKKILITGALGHIGSYLIRDFAQRYPGVHIVMIDNLSVQRYVSVFDLPNSASYRFVEGNVATIDVKPYAQGSDVVIQLAATTDAENSHAQREAVEENNMGATQRVAEACCELGIPIFYPSSTSVYGTQADVVDEDCPSENLKPQSPYAETKLREEALIQELVRKHGLRAVICRFGTIFGVSPGMRFHTVVNKFCWQAATGQPLTVWRTAYKQKRPYLDVQDSSRVIAFFINQNKWDGRVYNAVTSNHTVSEVVEIIREQVTDLEISLVDSPIMNQLSYNVGNKYLDALGMVFKGNLRKGIFDTLELLSNLRNER